MNCPCFFFPSRSHPAIRTGCAGFSLLELSIVLVMIGLLAGGVTYGRDLIRESEMRSLMSDIKKYHTAIISFRDKYRALPGDFNKAGLIWVRHPVAVATASILSTMGALEKRHVTETEMAGSGISPYPASATNGSGHGNIWSAPG